MSMREWILVAQWLYTNLINNELDNITAMNAKYHYRDKKK